VVIDRSFRARASRTRPNGAIVRGVRRWRAPAGSLVPMSAMSGIRREGKSDALVLFGITGDLAYQKIFPALQAMVRKKNLDGCVVGVARSGWSRDALLDRMRKSLGEHGGRGDAGFERFQEIFQYGEGDYTDPETFQRLKVALGDARRPLFYL